ncbi:MAG TPA: sugar phosphate nucleotidyltransferase [Thermoanaerobaculia bacterium]|nr:sugar phosphate nucleotidyltransferase [Thermoanaerobaculia bacterium]
MKAFLLAAGRGERFRPVTERLPKPLLPFLNVPLVAAHLERLGRLGVGEVGVNLHHLGDQIESYLREHPGKLPKLQFFWEPRILGTAGALRNAAGWLDEGDFVVVNADAAMTFDPGALLARHREQRNAATLLVVPNREPDRYTPLQAKGDRITGFGGKGPTPLLYTGVCAISPEWLRRIPPGEASLVADFWKPLLAEGHRIGWLRHEGAFADLGRPSDFLRATLEALTGAFPFPSGGGGFDPGSCVLAFRPPRDFEASSSVLGRGRIGPEARIFESAVWDGASVGRGARLSGCIAAGGLVAPGAVHQNVLLWGAPGEPAGAFPL